MTADVNVVVLDKNETIAEFRVAHQVGNLLEHALSGFVERMCFAGEYELDGAIRVVDHGSEPFDVGQDQIGSFVGGETTGKADGQGVGTQDSFETLQFF